MTEENLSIQPTEKSRSSAIAPFSKGKLSGFGGMGRNLFIFLVFLLMSLPLFTTFNEILTKFAEKTGAYNLLTKNVVPFETRAVALILKPLKIDSKPTTTHLYITDTTGKNTAIFFSWNCLGWQSAVLLVLTLITGLSGNYSIDRKLETLLLGISGTFLINILRISTVVVIAFYFGQLPATVVHDYGGTLFTVLWFFFYWWFSYTYILEA
jgi:exosortase/archaeosortase family protein